jgi:hypothetical protein
MSGRPAGSTSPIDVVALIKAVQRTCYTGPYCIECNSPEFRALPVHEATRRAADTATSVLHSAGVHASSPDR